MGLDAAAAQRARAQWQEETTEEREARIRRLMHLVSRGAYDVQSRRLAAALLEWDPRRAAPRQAAAVAERRRAYMREYMRRRRAAEADAGETLAALAAPAGWAASTARRPRPRGEKIGDRGRDV